MSAWDDPITHIRELEARLSRVKALADQWDKNAAADRDVESNTLRAVAGYIRAALEGRR